MSEDNQNKPKQRVIFYVDGFNFYFGMKDMQWRKYYWLDMVKFCSSFLNETHELVSVNYFSAIPTNNGKKDRQGKFFTCNKLDPKFKLHLGKFLVKRTIHKVCNQDYITFEEKETDVKIATRMIADVVEGKCDLTILISGDSDLNPPIEFIRAFKPSHKILVYFPPLRVSQHLKSNSHGQLKLAGYEGRFKSCQLSNSVTLANGVVLNKPDHWK